MPTEDQNETQDERQDGDDTGKQSDGAQSKDSTSEKQDDAGKFSQADVERMIKDRLDRERSKFEKQLAKFEGVDEKLQRLADLEEAQLTADEKQAKEFEKAQRLAQEAQQKAEAAERRAQDVAIRAGLVGAAAKLHFADPGAVAAMLNPAVFELDDEGNVTEAEALLGKLRSAVVGDIADNGATGNGRQAPNIDSANVGHRPDQTSLTPEELRIAQRMGISPEDYAKHKQT